MQAKKEGMVLLSNLLVYLSFDFFHAHFSKQTNLTSRSWKPYIIGVTDYSYRNAMTTLCGTECCHRHVGWIWIDWVWNIHCKIMLFSVNAFNWMVILCLHQTSVKTFWPIFCSEVIFFNEDVACAPYDDWLWPLFAH